jgi:arylformamidase
MKIVDISWPISPSMTAYKDRHVVEIKPIKTLNNDGVCETVITLGSHSGTHVDAPAHFKVNGKTIDQIGLAQLLGDCRVFDLGHVKDAIKASDLEALDIQPNEIILFKTQNSSLDANAFFCSQFVYLDAGSAAYLATKNIKAVGIDYLGIERGNKEHPAHNICFDNNVLIIEGLRLQNVAAGKYFFACLPIALQGVEAAPARAILIDRSLF